MKRLIARNSKGAVVLGPEIAKGGEATVFDLKHTPSRVAKVYRDPRDAGHAQHRIERLVAMNSRLVRTSNIFATRVLLPQDILMDPRSRKAMGFLMRRAEGYAINTLYHWFHPRTNPNRHDALRMFKYARNAAALVAGVHQVGLRVGDLNSTNFLANRAGAVFLIDVDSFVLPEPGCDAASPPLNCPVGKPEFLPPELQGIPLSSAVRGEHQDRWSLAVLIFLLLSRGTHPFDGRSQAPTLPTKQNERMRTPGIFPYANPGSPLEAPGRGVKAWRAFPPDVQRLMSRAFLEGQAEPNERPSAEDWLTALNRALSKGFWYCRREHSFPSWIVRDPKECPECGAGLGKWSSRGRHDPPPLPASSCSFSGVTPPSPSGRPTPSGSRRSPQPSAQRAPCPRISQASFAGIPWRRSAFQALEWVGRNLNILFQNVVVTPTRWVLSPIVCITGSVAGGFAAAACAVGTWFVVFFGLVAATRLPADIGGWATLIAFAVCVGYVLDRVDANSS